MYTVCAYTVHTVCAYTTYIFVYTYKYYRLSADMQTTRRVYCIRGCVSARKQSPVLGTVLPRFSVALRRLVFDYNADA